MERFGRPPDLPPELLANWAAEGQQITSWACDAASSFPTRPPFGLRALLERLFRAFVHSTSGAAKDASLVPSASQLAQLVKATCDAARSHLAPTSQVAEVTDERAVIDAIDREPVMSFVADMVWVLDSEQGEWERPTQQNNIKDPAKALETYKKEIGLQRLKLVELVKELASQNAVFPSLFKLRLEHELLFYSGLLPSDTLSVAAFQRKTVRNNTAQLYKQQKYNLLREESEGWGRILVELGSQCVSREELENQFDATREEVETMLAVRVTTVLRNIRSLVGYFDLDPNRVLDVIIDVFVANVKEHYDFFLRLLAESPWGRKTSWKSESATEGTAMAVDEAAPGTPAEADEEDDEAGPASNEADDQGPQPIPLLAQILGFKYQYYAARLASLTSEAGWLFSEELTPRERHAGEVPWELQLVAALLVRRGLVRVEDLWVHLGRGLGTVPGKDADFDDVEAAFKEWQTALRKKSREQKAASALADAAPLADDMPTSRYPGPPPPAVRANDQAEASKASAAAAAASAESAKSAAPTRAPPKLVDQKANFCAALLSVGAYHQALWILDRLPKLPYVQPDISSLLCRVLNHFIEPIYAPLRPIPKMTFNPPGLQLFPTIYWRDVEEPRSPRRNQRMYRWFYPDWTAGMEQWTRTQQLLGTLSGVLRYVTVQGLGSDLKLWAKLVRVSAHHFKTEIAPKGPIGSETVFAEVRPWLAMVSRYLLPALSTTYANPGLANEMWTLISQFPWPVRQSLYRDWQKRIEEVPELEFHKDRCVRDTQYFMKRISQETVRQLGRVLGKVVHGSPTLAYPIVLQTIEEHNNFIGPIVESSKYVTAFGIDVLSDSLLAKLETDRDRLKSDGVSVEKWFMNLATFASAALKKHADRMELAGFLSLVFERLTEKESVADLTILSEIIAKMAGIESIETLSGPQLEALGGGDLLRKEGVYGAELNRNTRRSSVKLRDTLLENKLAVAIAVAIGRERAMITHSDMAEHLKMISTMYDQCQDSLVQYAEFLSSSMDASTYSDMMPMADTLILDYHLEPDVAFHLTRPKLVSLIREADKARAKEEFANKVAAAAANAKASSTPSLDKPGTPQPGSVASGATPSANDDGAAAMDVHGGSTPVPSGVVVVPSSASPVLVVKVEEPSDSPSVGGETAGADASMTEGELNDGSKSVESKTSQKSKKEAPKDIWHPGLTEAIQRCEKILPSSSWKFITPAFYITFWQLSLYDIYVPRARYQAQIDGERAKLKELDPTDSRNFPQTKVGQERKRVYERTLALIKNLETELREQQDNHKKVLARLEKEKDHWFPVACKPDIVFQDCLGPRAYFSHVDASFCAKFIFVMHRLGTPNLNTVALLDRLLADISVNVVSATENEARHYGRFLAELLLVLHRWHNNQKAFNAEGRGEGAGLPGLGMISGNDDTKSLIDHKAFVRIYLKWCARLQRALTFCLTSGEYMRTRNAIIVLDSMLPSYPHNTSTRNELVRVLEDATKEEEARSQSRGDILQLIRNVKGKLVQKKDLHDDEPASSKPAAEVPRTGDRDQSSGASPRVPPGLASPHVVGGGEGDRRGQGGSLNPDAPSFVPNTKGNNNDGRPPPPGGRPPEPASRDKLQPQVVERRPPPPTSLPPRPSSQPPSNKDKDNNSGRPPPPPPRILAVEAPQRPITPDTGKDKDGKLRPSPSEDRERDRERDSRDRNRDRSDRRDRAPSRDRSDRDRDRGDQRDRERSEREQRDREREEREKDRKQARPGKETPKEREAPEKSPRDAKESQAGRERDDRDKKKEERPPPPAHPRPPQDGNAPRPEPPRAASTADKPAPPSPGITIAGRAKSVFERLGGPVHGAGSEDQRSERSESKERPQSPADKSRDSRKDERGRSSRDDDSKKESSRDDKEKSEKDKDRRHRRDRSNSPHKSSRSHKEKDKDKDKEKSSRGRSRSRSGERGRDREKRREDRDKDKSGDKRKRTDKDASPEGAREDRKKEDVKRMKDQDSGTPSGAGNKDGEGSSSAGRKRLRDEMSPASETAPQLPQGDSAGDSDQGAKRRKLDRNPSFGPGRQLVNAMTEAAHQPPPAKHEPSTKKGGPSQQQQQQQERRDTPPAQRDREPDGGGNGNNNNNNRPPPPPREPRSPPRQPSRDANRSRDNNRGRPRRP